MSVLASKRKESKFEAITFSIDLHDMLLDFMQRSFGVKNYTGGMTMEPWFQIVLTVISSVLASSGLWAYITKRLEKKDVKTEMLIGLGHDRIMYLGMAYIERGYITSDEYETL